MSREDEGNSAQLASTLKKLRAAGVKALFPEYSSNPKSLTEIAKSLNIPVAKPINTDGLAPDGHTFESMFKQNVGIIKEALSPSPGHDQHTPAPVFPYSGSRHPAGVLPL